MGVVAVLLTMAGALLVVLAVVPAVSAAAPPPQPSTASPGDGAASAEPTAPPASSSAVPAGPVLARSVPTRLDIDAIGVHSPLLQLGADAEGSVQVPPLEKDSKAGWFQESPTPGQLGPAVLVGHVDSAQFGPGVFYRLGAMQVGQQIQVTRSDATVAEFVVDRVESYPKDTFPSLQVYGNTSDAQLRLITCGGVFDRATRNYQDNIVIFAHLVTSRPS